MNILKNSLIIASYLVLTAVLFLGGYAIGNTKGREGSMITPFPHYETEAVSAISDTEEYILILEENSLNLYNVIGAEKTLKASENIVINLYPQDDINDLKNGLIFDDITKAQAVFEDFVS